MSTVYVVGNITIVDTARWAEYRGQVPATLERWSGQVLLRGSQIATLVGEDTPSEIVVIRFPDVASVNGWYASEEYQALIPLRDRAAEVVLVVYG